MKIDVEGAEMGVLRGAERVLRKYRPVLFVATHGEELERDCHAFLRDLGYRVEVFEDGETFCVSVDALGGRLHSGTDGRAGPILTTKS
jgi:hypothetical protein